MGWMEDLLYGPEKEGKAPDRISQDVKNTQIGAAHLQERILDDFRKKYIEGPTVEQEAGTQVNDELASLDSQKGDANRLLQSNLAMRGMGPGARTSIGEGLKMGQENDFVERRNAVRASIPQRIRALRDERSGAAVNMGSSALNSASAPIDFYGRAPERSGGFAPLLGGLIGVGMGGGVGGFQAGMGAGKYLQGNQNRRNGMRKF